MASKRIKHLRINLTNKVKYLYIENYKTLKKDWRRHTVFIDWKNWYYTKNNQKPSIDSM